MTLKTALLSLTVAATTLMTSAVIAPVAQAAAIATGSTLNLSTFGVGSAFGGGVNASNSTQLNFFGPLNAGSNFNSTGTVTTPPPLLNPTSDRGVVGVTNSTGTFSSLSIAAGLIKDLTLPSPVVGQRTNFLQIGSITLSPFSFNSVLNYTLANFTQFNATTFNFDGFFTWNGVNTPAFGQLTFQNAANLSSVSYSLSITAGTIPTPALLPGLIGFGVAALRKRQGEQAEVVEVEAIEVEV